MELLLQIVKEIQKNNGISYIVGGYVRDLILGNNPKDIDVEVYNILPDDLFKILDKFGNPKQVGKSFGVFKLGEYDFSIPRRERKTGSKHTDFDIECDPFMTPREACLRRDLTINALMMDPFTKEIHDFYNGLKDIENKTIRHISDRFSEDALRVIRVARFASRFGFSVDGSTTKLCESLLCELRHLPKERFFTEFENILLKSAKPSIAFEFLSSIGVIESYYPELDVLRYIEQGEKWHPEGTVWVHSLLAIDQIPMEERTLEIMLATLCHDMGKAIVKAEDKGEGHISFKYHAEDGVKPAEKFLRSLTNEDKLIEGVLSLVYHHMRPYEISNNLNSKSLRRLSLKVNIPNLLVVHKADKLGRGRNEDISYIDKFLELYNEIKNEVTPIIKGRDLINLGMEPGNYFGPILKQIFDAQLDEEFNNFEDGINWAKKKGII